MRTNPHRILNAQLDKSGGIATCWEWQGPQDKAGHGKLRSPFGNTAHRAQYGYIYGDIPKGKHVTQRCGNPLCCNPHHLRLGKVTRAVEMEVAK